MPGPYRRIDAPNVNQFVVTQPAEKAKAKPKNVDAPEVKVPPSKVAEPIKAKDDSKLTTKT